LAWFIITEAFFAYVVSQKRRATQRKKMAGQCFSAEMKTTGKNSANYIIFGAKKTTTKIVTYPLL